MRAFGFSLILRRRSATSASVLTTRGMSSSKFQGVGSGDRETGSLCVASDTTRSAGTWTGVVLAAAAAAPAGEADSDDVDVNAAAGAAAATLDAVVVADPAALALPPL
jgi:hypothetical protein